ncbi:MAG: 23S rRNA (adenine(2503)-C(2))-methyltransferase RlmN [Myxococcaceae bacterium]|nr:23S rRNA (adenine(2503)-C(2))-methyltransferase RlmN [Myxococcaceae bacterium]
MTKSAESSFEPSQGEPIPAQPKVDLFSLTLPDLQKFLVEELGEKPFRAKQIYAWLHQKGLTDFDQMTDLSKALRQKLKERTDFKPLTKDLEQRSVDGTIKYRWRTFDGRFIESVYMPSPDRRTLCVSTQVGCAMGCTFCATGRLGLARNLTPGEIVAQVHAVNREIRINEGISGTFRPLTNLVFMGMGEPLHNFENLKKALTILQSKEGPNFSARHITVSTVGLVPMIERFGKETEVKLAISLNATTDEQRSRSMPVNRKWNIAALMEAVRKFPLRYGRRVTFEYVLLKGFNDSDEDARRLIDLIRGLPAKVNLIPYNENAGLGYHTVPDERAQQFRELLLKGGVDAFIRENRGRDIAAACGQLANVDKRPPPARGSTQPAVLS